MSERPPAAPRPPGSPLFSVRDLRMAFDGTAVLSIDALRLEEGRITVLVGENGSGKTTLLRLMNGLIAPSTGVIEYRGVPLEAGGLRAVRAESVMVHQNPLLFRGTVRQNVGYGLRIRKIRGDEIARRVEAALSLVGLEGFAHRNAAGLSGGEKQRAVIARALALGPRVLILDEPTANVDPDSRVVVEKVIREASAVGTTVIMSTHAMELAYRLCDRFVRLERGRILPADENILKGRVERIDEQFTYFRTEGAVLRCPAREGDFRVAVLPFNEVILSREPLESSARNRLAGKITGVESDRGLFRVTIDCGVILQAHITTAAAADLGVETGHGCMVTFKASAVRLY